MHIYALLTVLTVISLSSHAQLVCADILGDDLSKLALSAETSWNKVFSKVSNSSSKASIDQALEAHISDLSKLMELHGIVFTVSDDFIITLTPGPFSQLNRLAYKALKLTETDTIYDPYTMAKELSRGSYHSFFDSLEKAHPEYINISLDSLLIGGLTETDVHEWRHLLNERFQADKKTTGSIFNASVLNNNFLLPFDEVPAYLTSFSIALNQFNSSGSSFTEFSEDFIESIRNIKLYLRQYKTNLNSLSPMTITNTNRNWLTIDENTIYSNDGIVSILFSPRADGTYLVTFKIALDPSKENSPTWLIPLKEAQIFSIDPHQLLAEENAHFFKSLFENANLQVANLRRVTTQLDFLVQNFEKSSQNLDDFYTFVKVYRQIIGPHL